MNSNSDFTTTFTAPVTPTEAFAAAARPQAWWNEMIEGTCDRIGETFTFDVPGLHHSRFEVVDAEPGQLLAWKVIPSAEETDLDEWLGSIVVFDFAPDPEGTRVTFTHRGLQPQLECHEVCSTAWIYHLKEAGLKNLLTTGHAAPITPTTVDDVARTVGAHPA